MKLPLVSVCIPTRNGAKYIEETLNCVYQQDYRPLELIISDDASSDETVEIILNTTAGWDITVAIYHHKPSGIGANWNNSVRKAKGKYIKFLFQDDLIYSNCISEMVAHSEKDESIGLTFCNRDIIGDLKDKEDWLHRHKNLSAKWNDLKPIQEGKSLLKQPDFFKTPRNKIGEPTAVLLKRQCFDEIGFFSEELKQTLDYEYWYRILPKYKIGYINKKLAAFRLHNNQASHHNLSGIKNEYLIYYKSTHRSVFSYLSLNNKVKIIFKIFTLTLRRYK
ncbi:MAG: glycosyltransferase family 2 protein [Draconibacterium sp.]